jgi:hypothetical protein
VGRNTRSIFFAGQFLTAGVAIHTVVHSLAKDGLKVLEILLSTHWGECTLLDTGIQCCYGIVMESQDTAETRGVVYVA